MIFLKQKRFNEFLNSIEEINPKTLSIRLKELEKDRLIKREVFDETPVKIEVLCYRKGKGITANIGTNGIILHEILL